MSKKFVKCCGKEGPNNCQNLVDVDSSSVYCDECNGIHKNPEMIYRAEDSFDGEISISLMKGCENLEVYCEWVRQDGYEGMTFIIPVSDVKDLLEQTGDKHVIR